MCVRLLFCLFCVVWFFWGFFISVAFFPSVLWYCWLRLLSLPDNLFYTVLVETLNLVQSTQTCSVICDDVYWLVTRKLPLCVERNLILEHRGQKSSPTASCLNLDARRHHKGQLLLLLLLVVMRMLAGGVVVVQWVAVHHHDSSLSSSSSTVDDWHGTAHVTVAASSGARQQRHEDDDTDDAHSDRDEPGHVASTRRSRRRYGRRLGTYTYTKHCIQLIVCGRLVMKNILLLLQHSLSIIIISRSSSSHQNDRPTFSDKGVINRGRRMKLSNTMPLSSDAKLLRLIWGCICQELSNHSSSIRRWYSTVATINHLLAYFAT